MVWKPSLMFLAEKFTTYKKRGNFPPFFYLGVKHLKKSIDNFLKNGYNLLVKNKERKKEEMATNYKELYAKWWSDPTRASFITDVLTTFNADVRKEVPFMLFPRQLAQPMLAI